MKSEYINCNVLFCGQHVKLVTICLGNIMVHGPVELTIIAEIKNKTKSDLMLP